MLPEICEQRQDSTALTHALNLGEMMAVLQLLTVREGAGSLGLIVEQKAHHSARQILGGFTVSKPRMKEVRG